MTTCDSGGAGGQVRDAASVMFLRDGHQGIEVFTIARVSTMQFAAGATVFPGGAFEPSDDVLARAWRAVEVDSRVTEGLLGESGSAWRRLLVTAIRETFEESSVLLGMPEGQAPSPQARERVRRALERNELDLRAVYSRFAASPDFSRLIPVARWITPEGRPRRYDTRFFITEAPRGQDPVHVPGEAQSAQWTEPRAALGEYERGEIHLMRPTETLLRALVGFSSVAECLDAAPFDTQVHPR